MMSVLKKREWSTPPQYEYDIVVVLSLSGKLQRGGTFLAFIESATAVSYDHLIVCYTRCSILGIFFYPAPLWENWRMTTRFGGIMRTRRAFVELRICDGGRNT